MTLVLGFAQPIDPLEYRFDVDQYGLRVYNYSENVGQHCAERDREAQNIAHLVDGDDCEADRCAHFGQHPTQICRALAYSMH